MDEDTILLRNYLEDLKCQAIDNCEQDLPSDHDYYQLASKLSPKDDTKLTYEEYCNIRDGFPSNLQKYMKTVAFLQLAKNENGAIFGKEISTYIQRSIDMERVYLNMMNQSSSKNRDYLTEKELALYIFSILPDLRNARDMEDEFIPYYMITSSRKFFFFHDHLRKGQISIKNLAHSTTMEELLYLKQIDKYENDIDPKVFREQLGANWFYHKNALYLFSLFTNLDVDQNGTLSVEEMLAFTGTSLEPAQFTRAACERIIQTHMSNSAITNELDYVGFINLVLAIEHKSTLASLQYFWKVLDVFDTGRLTADGIQYFYRDIHKSLRKDDYPAVPANVIVNEIFDILGCSDPRGASYDMFKKSGQGSIVASILLDVSCFLIYENREAQLSNQGPSQEDF